MGRPAGRGRASRGPRQLHRGADSRRDLVVKTSLPLPLCDVGVLVAAVACLWNVPLLVELTYFWGIRRHAAGGGLPGPLSPRFPTWSGSSTWRVTSGSCSPRCSSSWACGSDQGKEQLPRVFAITSGYTAFVGLVDWLTGANYMFLRAPPSEWTLLKVLGPWPWYIVSAPAW